MNDIAEEGTKGRILGNGRVILGGSANLIGSDGNEGLHVVSVVTAGGSNRGELLTEVATGVGGVNVVEEAHFDCDTVYCLRTC